MVWLGLGLGLGLGWRWRSLTPASSASDRPVEPNLQPLQLAYQLATEMSLFKGGFLARTSHELRSPLNGLIGMHQLILENLCDSPEEEREFIAQANQSALKMIKVLDIVLDVARLEQGKLKLELQPLQLATLLQTVHNLTYLQAADRNLRLQVTLPDPDLYMLADARRLQQVLLSLVGSAIAQMPEGCIQMSARASIASGYAEIWIDRDRLEHEHPAALSEPIDLLKTSTVTTDLIPSPGLNLLTSQILVSLMQGTLTVVESPEGSDRLRLQCSMPLVAPDSWSVKAVARG